MKATIIAIKKDFKHNSKYVPLIFKPRSMFTKGLFYIDNKSISIIRKQNLDKYLKIEYNSEETLNLLYRKNISLEECGCIYEFDFKQCWLDMYNDYNKGITFGNFKRKFFLGELPNMDPHVLQHVMKITIDLKSGKTFSQAANVLESALETFIDVFDEMKMSNKHYSQDDVARMIFDRNKVLPFKKLGIIVEPLINIISEFDNNSRYYIENFCNIINGKYQIVSNGYRRTLKEIISLVKNMIIDHDEDRRIISIIGTDNVTNNSIRNNELLLIAQLLELYEFSTYTIESGNHPEYFIRVNSDATLKRVIDNSNYKSMTLSTIAKQHSDSEKYMKYFFKVLTSDEQRWEFIEYYFLGRVESKYNIQDIKTGNKLIDSSIITKVCDDKNKIKTYYLLHGDTNELFIYYISVVTNKKLQDEGINMLSPNCELAQRLLTCQKGDVIVINEYDYLLENIIVRDV